MPVKLEIVEMAGAIMRRLAALIFLVSFCGSALAQVADDPELRRLTALLDAIRQEQQSVYKQFKAASESVRPCCSNCNELRNRRMRP